MKVDEPGERLPPTHGCPNAGVVERLAAVEPTREVVAGAPSTSNRLRRRPVAATALLRRHVSLVAFDSEGQLRRSPFFNATVFRKHKPSDLHKDSRRRNVTTFASATRDARRFVLAAVEVDRDD